MDVVNNGRVKTYTFGRKGRNQDDDEEKKEGPSALFTLLIELSTLDDLDIEAFVTEILSVSQSANFNV